MTLAVLGMRSLLPGSMPLSGVIAVSIATGIIVYLASIGSLFMRRIRVLTAFAMNLRSKAVPDVHPAVSGHVGPPGRN